jgi:hypothetical protein
MSTVNYVGRSFSLGRIRQPTHGDVDRFLRNVLRRDVEVHHKNGRVVSDHGEHTDRLVVCGHRVWLRVDELVSRPVQQLESSA